MGILVVNVGFMIGPIGLVLEPPRPEDSLFDQVGWWLLRVGFESKFMALFALLFGASAMLAGPNIKRHEARMLRLFPIGLLHGFFLFYGDILHAYAAWGFPLARLREIRGSMLLILGGVAFAWYLAITSTIHSIEAPNAVFPDSGPAWLRLANSSGVPVHPEFIALEGEVVRGGPSVDSTAYRMVVFTYVGIKGIFQTGWRVFALFLLGMWLTRRGLWDDPRAFRHFLLGIPIGLGLEIFAIGEMSKGTPYAVSTTLAHELGSVFLAVGIFVVLAAWRGPGGWLTRQIQAAGRMALTVYLTQSVFMFGLSHSPLWGEVGRWGAFGLAMSFWFICIFGSAQWLRYHSSGPVEQCWRRWADGRCGQHASATKGPSST